MITGFAELAVILAVLFMGIEPQMMTLGLQLSSAYMPISAAAIAGDYYEAMIEQSADLGVFGHGYTYSGHPVACAVASKVLDIYQRDNLSARRRDGELLSASVTLSAHPLVGEVRGRGLLAAVELVADKTTRSGTVGAFTQRACQWPDCKNSCRVIHSLCPPLLLTASRSMKSLNALPFR